MYEYFLGRISETGSDYIVLESNDIGYKIYATRSCMLKTASASGNKVKVYTYFNLREDAAELYGFAEKSEKLMFQKLISVNGIGPKTALAVLSANTESDLCRAVSAGDVKRLTKTPGIGPKAAQRIILELKDKILIKNYDNPIGSQEAYDECKDYHQDLMDALASLGYKESEISMAIEKNDVSGMSLEEAIKLVLKSI